VNLDRRERDCLERVPDRDLGVGVTAGVDHDRVRPALGALDQLDELALEVTLGAADGRVAERRAPGQLGVDLGERRRSVDGRIACPEQVEVRSMQHLNVELGGPRDLRFQLRHALVLVRALLSRAVPGDRAHACLRRGSGPSLL